MEDINLKILVTTRFAHPQLGGNEIHTKEFDITEGGKADEYYRKQRHSEKGNEAFMFTSVDVVNKKKI